AAAVETVVVEPGFADRDDARLGGQSQQVGKRRLTHVFFVGMDTGAGPKIVEAHRQRMHRIELLERRADAQRPVDLRSAHGGANLVDARSELGKTQMAMGVDVHGAGARRRGGNQIVCVGLDDEIDVPRISSIFSLSSRVLSSFGNLTPTPWVRPPDALAGVIHETLPATG